MKTNLQIELTDEERNKIAALIDGKQTTREISRKEVIAICQQHIAGLANSMPERAAGITKIMAQHGKGLDLYKADPADIPLMAQPDNPGYVRGWNIVKRDNRRMK